MAITRRGFLTSAGTTTAFGVAGLWLGTGGQAAAGTSGLLPRVPRGFRWGVAGPGFQGEGYAPDSNWSRYVSAKTASVQDPYQNSVDFRHRYAEDIRTAASLGVDTYRFGIEWARVQPEPGVWSPSALAYYDDVVTRIRAAGMRPMITLSHFVHPGWVVDNGGWAAERTVVDYVAYARSVSRRYRGMGVTWITFNEVFAYILLERKNGGLDPAQIPAATRNFVDAHRQAYDLIHEIDPGAQVTSNSAYFPALYAAADAVFIDQVADKLDFFGLDFYYGAAVSDLSAQHQVTDGKVWEIRPEPKDLYWALRYYREKFPRLPIYVVENGMATDNGSPRSDGYTRSAHLRDHLYWLQRALAEDIPVIGYNYWSLTDNYEWGSYRPRFGLYTVDVLTDPTLTRRPTDAVSTYRRTIANGGVPRDYTPVAQPALGSLADPPASLLDGVAQSVLPYQPEPRRASTALSAPFRSPAGQPGS
ncbi:family 1 glycosylhydrolase [Amycolatopsis nivea]|uniref:family 1 glycosylhydrolase n=1 Tax=Amycolatopsis nivea TaxID=1644109 RepID=UPI0010704ABB|nr:family 1 glycosylhydrolase [Amycolatopsis nivea]